MLIVAKTAGGLTWTAANSVPSLAIARSCVELPAKSGLVAITTSVPPMSAARAGVEAAENTKIASAERVSGARRSEGVRAQDIRSSVRAEGTRAAVGEAPAQAGRATRGCYSFERPMEAPIGASPCAAYNRESRFTFALLAEFDEVTHPVARSR